MATFILDSGLAITTNRLRGGGTEPLQIGWGVGTGTTARTDTTLFGEAGTNLASVTAAGIARTLGTSAQTTTNTTNDSWQLTGTRTCDTTGGTVTNAGCADAQAYTAASNFFIKGDFTGIGLAVGDGIAFTIKGVYDN